MPEIKVALVTFPYRGDMLEQLRRAVAPGELLSVNRFNVPEIASALKYVDVAFLSGDVDEQVLHAPNLRWIHCGHAGVEQSARPVVFERGLLLTSSAGRSSIALAEHAFFFMFALSYRYERFYRAQRARQWGIHGQHALQALYGRKLGIVGLGHTGTELAKRARIFGMQVLAYRRRSISVPEVNRIYSADNGDTLDPLLERSDFVILALPLSDQTYHLIGARELSLMKPSAYLINIARGGLVDEAALLAALKAGNIAGAGLDVTEKEPLPRNSALWDAPNTLITPHVTPQLPDRDARSLEILCENIQRYRADEPLINQLIPDDIYTVWLNDTRTRDFDLLRSSWQQMHDFAGRLSHWLRTR